MKVVETRDDEITLRELLESYFREDERPIIIWITRDRDIRIILYNDLTKDVYWMSLNSWMQPLKADESNLEEFLSKILRNGEEIYYFRNIHEFGEWLVEFNV